MLYLYLNFGSTFMYSEWRRWHDYTCSPAASCGFLDLERTPEPSLLLSEARQRRGASQVDVDACQNFLVLCQTVWLHQLIACTTSHQSA